MTTSLESLKQNVIHFLLRHADAEICDSSSAVTVQLDLTRADIASLFGMSRHEATLALNALKREGRIALEGSTITLFHENND